jgi:hypothetical protein
MRSALLVVAAALLGVCLFVKRWAGADLSGADYDGAHFHQVDAGVRFGLRAAVECENGACETHDLRDFDKIDRTGQVEGALASYAIGLAALALLVAAWIARGGGIIVGVRLALAAPCVASLVLSLVFALRLTRPRWVDLGWAPVVAILASLIGALAILVEKRRP